MAKDLDIGKRTTRPLEKGHDKHQVIEKTAPVSLSPENGWVGRFHPFKVICFGYHFTKPEG